MKKNNNDKLINVFTDGATVGHNGRLGTVSEVGIGVWIPSIELKVSKRRSGISNNEAEFIALLCGMEECLRRGLRDVVFHMDSQIVVNRANGNRPKGRKNQNLRMDNFQKKVRYLAQFFNDVWFIWIPREANEVADILSKRATYN